MNDFFHCSSVSKTFPTVSGPQRVLPGISLALGQGEILALLGASGCGKTTLLNILAGFLPPDAGEVSLEGRLCAEPGPDRAVVFQVPALFPWLSALENTEAGLKAAGMGRRERRALASDMLDLVGLAGHEDKLPGELSGGMRQRVALARVLALSPKVLLMDEPFAALDAITRERMQALLADLHQRLDMSILFVTHDVEEAVLLADAVCVMATGRGIVGRYGIARPRPRFRGDPELLPYQNMLRERLRGEPEAASN